jgi:hypothetical protein
MAAVIVAFLVALLQGATDIRTPEFGARNDNGQAVVEFVAPHCPRWDDEPCYVIVTLSPLTIEVGP